jgi:sugar lactone lactonase YvrE
MNRMLLGFSVICSLLIFALAGCEKLEPGVCKKDNDCKGQVKEGLPACYKEPPGADLGKCMTVKAAKAAHQRYQDKKSGVCVDKDGDGVKSGGACAGEVDCDDDDAMVKPGAAEVCDSKDNNCDGFINEGLKGCVGTVLGGKQDPVVQFMTTQTAGVEVGPDGTVWVTDQHRLYRLGSDFKAVRVAGSNKPGNEDKKGKFARFDQPRGMAVGADGSVYVTESRNNCVRRVAPDGSVSRFAGKCSGEADDTGLDEVGALTAARFWSPIDIAYDQDGSLLVVDMRNSKIKRITKDGKVETVAGRGGKEDEDGYIVFGYSDGAALKAEFNEPAGIAVGADGTVYIADMKNNCIRSLKNGKVGTFAGKCVSGSDKGGHKNGPVSRARFNQPNGVEVGPDGTVYVADTFNHCIRMIKNGKVTTFIGQPGQQGYYDGPITDALFNGPQSVSLAKDGSLYIVDFGNYRVRRVIP